MSNTRPRVAQRRTDYRQWKTATGRMINAARHEKGWTLGRCEQQSGLKRSEIDKIEMGYGAFNLPGLFYLLHALGLTLSLTLASPEETGEERRE